MERSLGTKASKRGGGQLQVCVTADQVSLQEGEAVVWAQTGVSLKLACSAVN